MPSRPTFTYHAALVRVIDGDTIVANLDLGFRLRATLPLRLLGINSPEIDTDAGKTAKAFTLDWCTQTGELIVTTEQNPEKYGRWLATVHRPGTTESLNAALLRADMAVPYMVRPEP